MGTIAVIPIFVNAGAAVLPTILTAVASVAMVAFKPRELAHLLRRRPVALGVPAGAITIGLAIVFWCLTCGSSPHAAQRGPAGTTPRYDWAKVAQELIAQQRVREESVVGSRTSVVGEQGRRAGEKAPSQEGQNFPLSSLSTFSPSLNSSPVKLSPLWSFCPEDTMFLGTPAVAGNRIFAAGCQAELGSYTGLLACLDSETGKPLWQISEIKGEPLRAFFSSPVVTGDGKYLVIGQGLHEDRDCSLLCFEATTGQLRWAVKTPLHIESSPAIFGDMAVVGAGAVESKDGKPVGDPGYCLAVRISDGLRVQAGD
ncbi:MAG: PQQ-binding-like beta-propeller repeat protein [Phycisphaerae bacterium]|nr:PQQ-binding-like beta-propeller repeat protein [Phycisphaerae bacterium]